MTRAKLLTEQEELDLSRIMRGQDKRAAKAARDRLISSNDGLVYKYAHDHRSYARSEADFEDMVQEGRIGLMRGVDRFCPDKAVERGARISTYVSWYINQALHAWVYENRSVVALTKTSEIRNIVFKIPKAISSIGLSMRKGGFTADEIEDIAIELNCSTESVEAAIRFHTSDQSMDAPTAEEGSATFGDMLSNTTSADHENDIVDEMDREARYKMVVDAAREILPPRDFNILMSRYGRAGSRPLARISEDENVSKERIRQIEERSIDMVKRRVLRNTAIARARAQRETSRCANTIVEMRNADSRESLREDIFSC
jgi:RNA polymerase sigma factor (sigma-70 family)